MGLVRDRTGYTKLAGEESLHSKECHKAQFPAPRKFFVEALPNNERLRTFHTVKNFINAAFVFTCFFFYSSSLRILAFCVFTSSFLGGFWSSVAKKYNTQRCWEERAEILYPSYRHLASVGGIVCLALFVCVLRKTLILNSSAKDQWDFVHKNTFTGSLDLEY